MASRLTSVVEWSKFIPKSLSSGKLLLAQLSPPATCFAIILKLYQDFSLRSFYDKVRKKFLEGISRTNTSELPVPAILPVSWHIFCPGFHPDGPSKQSLKDITGLPVGVCHYKPSEIACSSAATGKEYTALAVNEASSPDYERFPGDIVRQLVLGGSAAFRWFSLAKYSASRAIPSLPPVMQVAHLFRHSHTAATINDARWSSAIFRIMTLAHRFRVCFSCAAINNAQFWLCFRSSHTPIIQEIGHECK